MDCVDVKHSSDHQLALEWTGSSANDMVADSVLALLLGIDSSPASVKSESCPCLSRASQPDQLLAVTTRPHSHQHRHPYAEPPSPPPDEEPSALARSDFGLSVATRVDRLIAFLDSHFGNIALLQGGPAEDQEDVKPEEEGEEGQGTAEDEMKEEAGDKLPLPPRIRVKLDDHWADVSLDDFVRFHSAFRRFPDADACPVP